MAYTKVFERPYSGGWVDYPSETTPITADALNEYDTTFQHVENYLEDNPILEISSGAGFHNSIFRGKNLGTSVTNAQWAAIQDGSFDDLFIGDYWVINGVNWRIAHFDYWLNTGETKTTDHHIVIVPDTNLYNKKMNDTETATTAGGYSSSTMRNVGLTDAKTAINSAFGSTHIMTYRDQLTTAVSSSQASAKAYTDCDVEIMSEIMVFGTRAWGNNGYEVGMDKTQFALFRLAPELLTNRFNWWLRSVGSATTFSSVIGQGYSDRSDANTSKGVRPCFALYDPIPTA